MKPQLLLLIPLMLIVLPGCADRTATVSGKVTYKNKALSGGTVIFANEDATKFDRVPIQSDGTYTSSKVPYGKLNVGVEPAPKGVAGNMPKGVKRPEPPKDSPVGDVYGKSSGEYVDIPMELRSPKTSKITVTVDSDPQTIDITLPPK